MFKQATSIRRLPFGVLATVVAVSAVPVLAESRTFNFKDPKGVNTIAFVLDSQLEPIMGLARGIAGTVDYDPKAPEKTSGEISVDADSVQCAHPNMTEVLHSDDWIDVKKHPEIRFRFKNIKKASPAEDGSVTMTVVGDFTCKGITKELTVPVHATYLPRKMGNRIRGKNGDLLVLRSNFSIRRKDFNIKPTMGPAVVAEDIELRVSIVGWHETR